MKANTEILSYVARQITSVKHKIVISQMYSFTVRIEIIIAQSKRSYLYWSLACKISNFASGSGTFWKISLPINVTEVCYLKFLEHSFFAKIDAKQPNFAKLSPNCR